jgi:hypothetical protein
MRFATKMKIIGLGLALVVTGGLTAVATRDTNAYFSDTKPGVFTGTLGPGTAQCPYFLEPGTSKARHWDSKGCQRARVLPIAQYDSSGALFLDFGDEVRQNSNASPDVFRLVSLVDEPRAVTFSVTGPMAAFVTVVRLSNCTSGVLQGHATESVYIKIRVPDHAQPGTYTGTLTVHVDGWAADAQVPMTISVRSTEPKDRSAPARPRPLPRRSTTSTPTQTPCTTPTPAAAPSASTPTPTATAGANGV